MKFLVLFVHVRLARLPPWGGSGLKWFEGSYLYIQVKSPSLGREWIEMAWCEHKGGGVMSPSLGREWIEIPWDPSYQQL